MAQHRQVWLVVPPWSNALRFLQRNAIEARDQVQVCTHPPTQNSDTIVRLVDFSPEETVAQLGLQNNVKTLRIAHAIGGIPDALDRLAACDERELQRLLDKPLRLQRVLGSVGVQILHAIDLALAEPRLRERLVALAVGDPLPLAPDLDPALRTAGLIRGTQRDPSPNSSQLRAPWLGAWINSIDHHPVASQRIRLLESP